MLLSEDPGSTLAHELCAVRYSPLREPTSNDLTRLGAPLRPPKAPKGRKVSIALLPILAFSVLVAARGAPTAAFGDYSSVHSHLAAPRTGRSHSLAMPARCGFVFARRLRSSLRHSNSPFYSFVVASAYFMKSKTFLKLFLVASEKSVALKLAKANIFQKITLLFLPIYATLSFFLGF